MAQHLNWQWVAPAGPAPNSYNLYKGMAPGAEVLYKTAQPGLSFSDPEATPGSTYFGYVTAVYAGVESGPSNEFSVTVPASPAGPGNLMSETHIFSTGILTAQIGAGPPVTFGVLQDVSFGASFSRHDLFDAVINSAHAVDTADHEGKWTIKAGNAAISGAAMQMLIASALTTASAPVVPAGALGPGVPVSLNTLSGKIAFPLLTVTLTLQDTNGHPVTVYATRAKAMGDQVTLKLTDFAMQNFELHCYPDPAFPDPATGNRVAVITFGN
jgi:hypothetical protein